MGMKPEEPLGGSVKSSCSELPAIGYEEPRCVFNNAAELQFTALVGRNRWEQNGGRLAGLQ